MSEQPPGAPTPSPGRPPTPVPADLPSAPPPGWAPPPLPTSFTTGYPPPSPPAALEPVAAPLAQQARPRRRGWVIVVAAIVVVGVLAAVAVLWLRGVMTPPPVTPPSGSPVPTAPVKVQSGDVGRTIDLRADAGTARVTITTAEWTPTGELKPEPGTTYLVVALEFSGVSGEVPVGPVMTVAETADKKQYAVAYGPSMPDLPPGALLHAGDSVKGSVGFMLPPAEVTLHFLDADGGVMGSARIPAP